MASNVAVDFFSVTRALGAYEKRWKFMPECTAGRCLACFLAHYYYSIYYTVLLRLLLLAAASVRVGELQCNDPCGEGT